MQDKFYDNDNNLGILSSEGLFNTKDLPKIRVVVRKRPLSRKEQQRNDIDIIESRGSQTIVVKELK
jgi:hypothetical protein